MDRKKRLDDFVKDVYSKYNPGKESKDLLLRMCHSLYEQCPTDKELEEKLEKIEGMYKSMHELRGKKMDRKTRIESLIKELEDKYPNARGLYKTISLDAIYDPKFPEDQVGSMIKKIEDTYRRHHESPKLKDLFNSLGDDYRKLGATFSEYANGLNKLAETWKATARKALEAEKAMENMCGALTDAKKAVDANGEALKDLQRSVTKLEEKGQAKKDQVPCVDSKKLN